MGQKEFSNWGRKLGLPNEGIGGIVVGPDVCMLGWIRVLDGFKNESLQLSHEIFRLATQETDIWISATHNQDPSCPTSQQEEDKETRLILVVNFRPIDDFPNYSNLWPTTLQHWSNKEKASGMQARAEWGGYLTKKYNSTNWVIVCVLSTSLMLAWKQQFQVSTSCQIFNLDTWHSHLMLTDEESEDNQN